MATARAWDGTSSMFEDEAEQISFFRTIDSFYQYRHQAHYNTTHRRRQQFYALPREHQELLLGPPFNLRDRFNAVDDAIDENAVIAECILKHALETFGLDVEDGNYADAPWRGTCTSEDLSKASTTINQFYRDWSAEGAVERDAHFGPVMDDLTDLFLERNPEDECKVLVPGAGLGRLVFEICAAGFSVEGNEISFHALLASSWVLNALEPDQRYPLHPFVLKFSNHERIADQLKMVQIPDIHVASELQRRAVHALHAPRAMSMSASDFLTAYRQESQREAFDVVVTVFFLDTAPNVLRYIETIRHTLKEDGVWINVGPLLWHFEDSKPEIESKDTPESQKIPGIEEPGSVELTHEDIINLVRMMGFVVDVVEIPAETSVGYIQQRTSMLQSTYRVSHFTARKVSQTGS